MNTQLNDFSLGVFATPWLPVAVALIALVAVAVAGAMLLRGGRPRYVREVALFSAAEWAFFEVLEQAVGGQYRIFGKVRLADLMTPSKTGNRKDWWRAFTKISSKHADFVLVHRQTAEILAAIEVDDRSHGRGDRQDRDAFVDAAFAQAGIPLIRVRAQSKSKYRPDEAYALALAHYLRGLDAS